MIQDDPINQQQQKQQKEAIKIEYLPVNLDSEEEIGLKGIETASDPQKSNENKTVESNEIYYKYAMLIGLCK